MVVSRSQEPMSYLPSRARTWRNPQRLVHYLACRLVLSLGQPGLRERPFVLEAMNPLHTTPDLSETATY
jgi:hypothetical protein